MKWIKFNDMKPPIGMYIFVTLEDDVSILRWEKEYNEWDSTFVPVYSDGWCGSKEIYALNFWAPVSFFKEHMPDAFEQDELKPEDDWYFQNKDHPNIDKIKNIVNDLDEKSPEQFSEMIKTSCGFSSYGYLKRGEVIKLFEEINYPNRQAERDQAFQESLKTWSSAFDAALLKVKTPNLISKLQSNYSKLPVNLEETITLRRDVPDRPIKYYRNIKTGKVIEQGVGILVSEIDDWELIQ